MADTMAMQQQEETMSRTMSPRTELPGFQTIAEMQTTQRTSIGLCDDTPVYINPAAETLQRTMPWGEEVTDRWSQELPVLTTAIEIAAPGAYRLEKDDTGRVVYSPVKARKAPIAEAKATKRALEIAHLNCDHEYGIWAMHLVSNNPQLVVSEEEPPRCLLRRGYHGFDLDFCAGEIDVDTLAVCYRVCQHLVEDCNALRGN